MGTGRLQLAVLPALMLLSLSPAEPCRARAAWVLTQPLLRASAGDSVQLQCCLLGLVSPGGTMTKVDWLRLAGDGTQKDEMVFYYYHSRGIPVGRFQERAQWLGDVSRWDGSIQLQDLRVNDSGTYVCEVRLRDRGSVLKNRTVLHVSPAEHAAGQGAAVGAQDSAARGDSKFWAVAAGGGCVAVVLAFLAGLGLRRRSTSNTALERTGNDGSKNKAEQEALYSSIPGGTEVPKAEQDAQKKKRAEETYITMHPSAFRENGVYVELAKRVIPAEWMQEGAQGDGHREEPCSRPQAALPRPPEGEK